MNIQKRTSPAHYSYSSLTFWQRLGLGFGGIPDLGMQYAIAAMAYPIFNLVFGVSPITIGIALSLPRLWEIFIDPWIGSLSDRTRGVLGRRHPYILAGGILGGLIFAATWWVPLDWSVQAKGIWLIVVAMLHYTAFSFFMVPYSALLGEITSDPLERTKIMAMRSVFTTCCTGALAWLYWFCQRPIFGDTVHGMRFVGIAFGCLMALGAIIPTCVCRRARAIHLPSVAKDDSFFATMKELFSVREFRMQLLAVFLLITGLGLISNFGFYITVYYMFGGDTRAASLLGGVTGIVSVVAGVIGCQIVSWLARRIGRRQSFRLFIFFAIGGAILSWWTNRPQNPYASLVSAVLVWQGLTAFWIFMPALTGEISNRYEKQTGRSLFASFFAFYGISIKLGGSISLLLTGFMLNATGFQLSLGKNQPPSVFLEMRGLSVLMPVLSFALSYWCLRGVWKRVDQPLKDSDLA